MMNYGTINQFLLVSVTRKITELDTTEAGSTRSALLTVSFIFLASLSLLVWTYTSFPKLEEYVNFLIKSIF